LLLAGLPLLAWLLLAWLLLAWLLLPGLLLPGLPLILVETGLLLGGVHRAGSPQRRTNSQPAAALAVALL
jgi:hypothetical protein